VRQGSGRALFVRIGSMHMGLQLRSLRRLAVGSLLSVAGLMFAQDGSLQGLLAAHQYAETLRGADVQLQARKADPQLWFVKGLALAGLGRASQSLASLDQALVLSHNATPVLEAAAQTAYGARNKRAGHYLDMLLAQNAGNQVAQAMAGVLAYERKDCPAAEGHFAKAHEAMKGNLPAEMQYGDCLLQTGGVEQGTTLFEELARANPNVPVLGYDEAVAYMRAGRFADAVRVLKGMQASGEMLEGDTLNLLGAAYSGNGQLAEAIAAYRQGAQESPTDDRNYIDLAILSVEHQSPRVAVEVLDAGIRVNPKSAALYALRGAVRAQLSQNDAAAEDFEAANRLDPSKLYGAVGLGVLLRDTSKLGEAEQLLRERLRAHPNDATLNYLVADVLIREGVEPGAPRFAEARRLLVRAVRLKPDLAVAYGELGKLDLKAGRSEEAIGELETGVRYDSTDRTSLNQLIAAYRRAGRTEDAARVAGQLAKDVAGDRAQETERNRVRITVAASPGAGAEARN